MTELSFLIELMLKHKLPKITREAVAARISEVERNLSIPMLPPAPRSFLTTTAVPAHIAMQPASTQAALMRQEQHVPLAAPQEPAPIPVAAIAQTPATAAALASREQAIAEAVSGKFEKGRTSPRKF